MNLSNILEAAKKMQADLEAAKAALASEIVTGEAGGGMVTCQANGNGDVVSVVIDPSLLNASSAKIVQDLVAGATNQALAKARALGEERMSKLAGNSLPSGLMSGPLAGMFSGLFPGSGR